MKPWNLSQMPVGSKINFAMEVRGLKQADLARRAGLKPSTIGDLVLARNKQPTLAVAAKIAHALGVSLQWLADDELPDDELPDWSSSDAVEGRKRLAYALVDEIETEVAIDLLKGVVLYKDMLLRKPGHPESSVFRAYARAGYGSVLEQVEILRNVASASIAEHEKAPQSGDRLDVDIQSEGSARPKNPRKKSG